MPDQLSLVRLKYSENVTRESTNELEEFLSPDIWQQLGEKDRVLANEDFQRSLENNKIDSASSWSNPDSGHSGGTTPTRTYSADSGGPCREFVTSVVIEGEEQENHGAACRNSSGDDAFWEIVQ